MSWSLKEILNDHGLGVGIMAIIVITATTLFGCILAFVFGWPITI